jgi:protein SCO1
MNKLHWVGFAAIAVVGFMAGRTLAPPAQESTRPGISFELSNTNGGTTTADDLRGYAALVFFGYTHCPDVCPTTLARMRAVKRALGSIGDRFKGVFITVDPDRDTPEHLDAYVHHFDSDFLALTGTTTQLRSTAAEFGAVFSKGEATPDGGYLMEHTAFGHLVAPSGTMAGVFPHDMPVDDVVKQVKAILSESPPESGS